MFGKNHINPNSKYDWRKWCTPARDLTAAFDAEGDTVRRDQAIVWGQPSWSNYYPFKSLCLYVQNTFRR